MYLFSGILTYTVQFDTTVNDSRPIKELKSEILVKTFIWAQWDMMNQVLYHIHHRQIAVSLVSENENNSKSSRPTLSGLQFHDDLPHETVVRLLSKIMRECKNHTRSSSNFHRIFLVEHPVKFTATVVVLELRHLRGRRNTPASS